jgi:hypothetical protein
MSESGVGMTQGVGFRKAANSCRFGGVIGADTIRYRWERFADVAASFEGEQGGKSID